MDRCNEIRKRKLSYGEIRWKPTKDSSDCGLQDGPGERRARRMTMEWDAGENSAIRNITSSSEQD